MHSTYKTSQQSTVKAYVYFMVTTKQSSDDSPFLQKMEGVT